MSRSKKDQIVWGPRWEPTSLLLQNMLSPTLQPPTCTHYPAEQEERALTAHSLTQNPISFSRAMGSPASPKDQVAPQALVKGWLLLLREKSNRKSPRTSGKRGCGPQPRCEEEEVGLQHSWGPVWSFQGPESNSPVQVGGQTFNRSPRLEAGRRTQDPKCKVSPQPDPPTPNPLSHHHPRLRQCLGKLENYSSLQGIGGDTEELRRWHSGP